MVLQSVQLFRGWLIYRTYPKGIKDRTGYAHSEY